MQTKVKSSAKKRRAGGRAARQALRAAPLAEDIKPVRPGMESTALSILSQNDIREIYGTALKLLAEVGLSQAPDSGKQYMLDAGARIDHGDRVCMDERLVDHMLSKAAKEVTLFGRDSAFDIELKGPRVHYGTAGAAVSVVDPDKNAYRESTLQDLFNAARLVSGLEHIHFFQRPMVARDIPDNRQMDINSIYACLAGTKKHVGVSFVEAPHVHDALELLHLVAGSEENWRTRPFISNSNCFVVPPMRFATESCLVMEECVKGGMPVLLLSAGQAGATAPASLPGAVAQATAECLAGLVYVNAMKPGAPAIFGTWPFVSDLRTGAMSGGSGEQALLTAACAQMGRYLGVPCGAAAGMTDAKLPDLQCGFEQGISNVMAGLSGLNMVYESVGMHASLLGFCFESLVIGNDMIGQCLRCVRGFEVHEDNLSFDTIRSVCLDGPGHYLGHGQTLDLMQRDYIYPAIADRSSPKEWDERGKPEIVNSARAYISAKLAEPAKPGWSVEIDQLLRQKFSIHLNDGALDFS